MVDVLSSLVVLPPLILATYRIARFITADTFPPMAWLRTKIAYKVEDRAFTTYPDATPGGPPTQGETTVHRLAIARDNGWSDLIECPHCVGVYVAFAATFITNIFYEFGVPWLVALAVAGGQSYLASRAED